MFKRVIVVVLDSVESSTLPNVFYYGVFANMLTNIARQREEFFLFLLGKIGLGSIEPIWVLNDLHN
ncbi:MAG: hypothetical protein K0R78_1348 [Pelosinus sp.]|jgi:phosphopentomutase|nr:hypothetical protein [Pelosinus sp.]